MESAESRGHGAQCYTSHLCGNYGRIKGCKCVQMRPVPYSVKSRLCVVDSWQGHATGERTMRAMLSALIVKIAPAPLLMSPTSPRCETCGFQNTRAIIEHSYLLMKCRCGCKPVLLCFINIGSDKRKTALFCSLSYLIVILMTQIYHINNQSRKPIHQIRNTIAITNIAKIIPIQVVSLLRIFATEH